MRIAAKYSHMNGEEYLLVHKPALWNEIQAVISQVDAKLCKTKESKEKTMRGRTIPNMTFCVFGIPIFSKSSNACLSRTAALIWKVARIAPIANGEAKNIAMNSPSWVNVLPCIINIRYIGTQAYNICRVIIDGFSIAGNRGGFAMASSIQPVHRGGAEG